VAALAHNPRALPPALETGLNCLAVFHPPAPTYPNGCHICEVEIDPETGAIRLDRYTVVDDVGTVINPLTLKGQVMGGVVQGAGQALWEAIRFDEASGQLVSGSFMDYAMPRADDVPFIAVASHPVPTSVNPLGAKGAGEAGTVGALSCVHAAVMDALASRGVSWIDMPLTAEAVWRALRSAGDNRA
jgi:carbon-monoxide dehydrogenase large subunit